MIVFLVLLSSNAAAAAPGDAGPLFGFRVTGGYTYISYGNYNDFVTYMNDEVLPQTEIVGATFDEIHWLPEFKGEVVTTYIPRIEAGIGVGIISGSADFGLSAMGQSVGYKHKVKTYPITVTAYYDIPVSAEVISPRVWGGFGAYHATVTFEEFADTEDLVYDSAAELDTWGFGIHGGAGVAFAVASRIAIDIGVFGRWAKIEGFEGKYSDSEGNSEDVYLAYDWVEGAVAEGREDLYYGHMPMSMKGTYGEGAVDLSGYGVMLGFTVMF
jgi:hypothetical protein